MFETWVLVTRAEMALGRMEAVEVEVAEGGGGEGEAAVSPLGRRRRLIGWEEGGGTPGQLYSIGE